MASDNTMRVEIITPDDLAFESDAKFVLARATDGDLGILPLHAPMVAALSVWPVRIDTPGGESKKIAVFGGFMKVDPETVRIVTPHCEMAATIDLARAERAKERAESRLAARDESVDVARAEAALRRAVTRIDVVSALKK